MIHKPFDAKAFLKNLTTHPGIYQMLDAKNHVLYVGKARNLKHRVSNYFRSNLTDLKTIALMQQVCDISVTITHTENDALLLESNLIKELRPRYNILLKDDKSYPYLFLSTYSPFPRLSFHRGAQNEKGEYFGPYPSASAVHETLDLLQKLFKIRQCTDSFFKSRTRPCLQYQIQRCTAPCVDYIDQTHYQENVLHALLFLKGKNDDVIKILTKRMEAASEQQAFEEAARYRDQIISLRYIQQHQYMSGKAGDIDVISIAAQSSQACISMLYIRNGRLIGNKSYFPKIPENAGKEDILSEFLPQYYLSKHRGHVHPKKIMLNMSLDDQDWIENALSENFGHKVTISHPKRGDPIKWLNMALLNANHALATHLSNQLNIEKSMIAFQEIFKLPQMPERIECFDISHTMGEATVASCVVFGKEGPIKTDYRRFNISGITPGDDYAAMLQALTRRYTSVKEKSGALPDVLMIDGGKGQLAQAKKVLEELQIDTVMLLGIAKGEGRKPGLEKLFLSSDTSPIKLASDSPALHLIQRIRDEAHRFAIVGHRQQRAKIRTTSQLEDIPGIGPKKRRELLRYFGGLQGIKNANIEELIKVSGIRPELAKRIHDALHGDI